VGIEEFLSNHILILTIVSNFITIIILSLFFRIKKKRLLKEAGALNVSYRSYLLPVICALSFSMFMNLLTYGIEFNNHSMVMQSMAYYSSKLSGSGNILSIVCLLFAAPLCEEIIFRGLIMKRLMHSFSPEMSILISSLLFGLMHLMAGGFLLCLFSVLIGGIFGLTYMETHSLIPAIAAHAAANFVGFITLVMPSFGESNRIGFSLSSLSVFLICFIRLAKRYS